MFDFKVYLDNTDYCPLQIDKKILNDKMINMDLWDTKFPYTELSQEKKSGDELIPVNSQFLFMVKFYIILAILFEKMNEKIPSGITYVQI